jgi:uncharacterized protein
MTLKRLILTILTLLVVLLVGSSLVKSWSEPQISSRLQLYQTDLILTASELQQDTAAPDFASASKVILGADPIASAQKEYQTARQSAEVTLQQFQTRLDQLTAPVTSPSIAPVPTIAPAVETASRDREFRQSIQQQQDLIDQLDRASPQNLAGVSAAIAKPFCRISGYSDSNCDRAARSVESATPSVARC